MSGPLRQLDLYRTAPHVCGYLPGREARSLVVDPTARLDPVLYEDLLAQGFRRSGAHVYRPWCDGCAACVAVRVPVRDFAPSRRQRRAWRDGGSLQLDARPAAFREEHFRLYQAYTAARHGDSEMADATAESYLSFLTAGWAETRFVELRRDGRLVAVAVTDLLPHSLSAVYTFFDPALARHSPGVVAVLHQIELARAAGRDWLYLGYWIEGCRKMSYKADYRPLELHTGSGWRRCGPGEALDGPSGGPGAPAAGPP